MTNRDVSSFAVNASVVVRAAEADDVTDIEDIVGAAYAKYIPRIGSRPAPMTVDYRDIVARTDRTYVLVDDTAVVGVLVIVIRPDHVLIENVAVAPGAQGRGYGRTLLAYAEQRAGELDLQQTRLYTNAAMTENLTFYRSLGYVEVDRRTDEGFARVFFHKNLG